MDRSDLIQQLSDVIADAHDAGMADHSIRGALESILIKLEVLATLREEK